MGQELRAVVSQTRWRWRCNERRIDFNCRDRSGRSPLMLASMRGNLEMVELLLGLGAKENAAGRQVEGLRVVGR